MLRQILTIIAAISALILAPMTAQANFKCWTNKDGVRECGQVVPPEYSQQQIEMYNSQGVRVKVDQRAKTPEELEEEKRIQAEKQKQAQIEAEKRHRDRVLLRSFSTERDLSLSYKKRITTIENIIELTQSNNKSLQDRLDSLTTKAADIERVGNKVPQKTLDAMADLKRQMANNDDFIQEKRGKQKELQAEYENELARYRELKSLKPR